MEVQADPGPDGVAGRKSRLPGRRCQAADSHEIWHHPATRRCTSIPNHPGNLPEGTLSAILKQVGIEPEVLLRKK